MSRKASSAQVRRGVHQAGARPVSQCIIGPLLAFAGAGEYWRAAVDEEALRDRMSEAERARCRETLRWRLTPIGAWRLATTCSGSRVLLRAKQK